MRTLRILAVTCSCLLLPGLVLGGGFTMKPGKWQFTTTTVMPMMPQPQTMSSEECITPEEAAKDPLAELVDRDGCTVTDKKISGSTLRFTMRCEQQGMVSQGQGYFTAHGDTASGKMEIKMDMPAVQGMPGMTGGPMVIKTTWQGKRIGACD